MSSTSFYSVSLHIHDLLYINKPEIKKFLPLYDEMCLIHYHSFNPFSKRQS